VLEYLLRRGDVSPALFLVGGFLYTFLSGFLSDILFSSQASVAHVLLVTVATAPALYFLITRAARELERRPLSLIDIQRWLLLFYMAFTVGSILGFYFSYTVLPQDMRERLMELQAREIAMVRGLFSGRVVHPDTFWVIFRNNLRVYAISIFLSLFYGTGGVLLLSWNASLVGAFLSTTRHPLLASLELLPHGIFEFMGYFVGGITGILIGVAIVEEGWNRRLLRDVLLLFVLGIAFIFLGALVEAG